MSLNTNPADVKLPQLMEGKGGASAWKRLGSPMLCESVMVPGTQAYRVSGVFQNYKLKNSNGRIYPKKLWETLFKEDSEFMDRVKRRNVLGHIEHPSDGITRATDASHVVVEVRIATPEDIRSNSILEDGDIIGTYEVLNSTPNGKIIGGLIEQNIDFGGVSSRGNGTVTETSDAYEVNDDYMLETWDIVFTPSVSRARPLVLKENQDTTPPTNEDHVLEAKNHLGEPEQATYSAWRAAVKKAGAVKFDGDKDICQASDADGNDCGQWEGDKGSVRKSKKKNESTNMTESSFVLITGLYGPGKPSESKKFIPIELIAESKNGDQSFFWESKATPESAPKLGRFQSFNEAMQAMTTFCESTGGVFTTEEPQNQTTPPTPSMNPTDRIRAIQAEAVLLSKTKLKGLRLSEASSLLEKCRSLRIELSQISESNKHFGSMIQPISKVLEAYEEELDAPPTDDMPEDDIAPPPPAAAPASGPPAPGPSAGGEMSADEAREILDGAVEALRQGGNEDQAAELERVSNQIADAEGAEDPAGGDPAGDLPPEDDFDMDSEAPPMGDEDVPKLESSARARRKFVESYRKLRSRYARMAESTSRLLKAYRKNLNESKARKPEGSAAALKEATTRASKSESAAREIAERYNTEMIGLGKYIWEAKRPKLYAGHKDKLSECKTWRQFEELSSKIIFESGSADDDKSDATVDDIKLDESKKAKAAVITEGAKPKVEPEAMHPMIESIIRARRKGNNVFEA